MGVSTKVSRTGERMSSKSRSRDVRALTCGSVMERARKMGDGVSISRVIHVMCERDWDHLFLVDDAGVPVGRIHAVDLLKMVDRKRVNRSVAWTEAVPALQCVSQPPMQVRESTPLLKAAVLMLTHDLNQLAVVDDEGALAGVVSHATVARHLPRYLL